jgi:hypothetical protein
VPNTILRRWELLSSDKSQVEFTYDSPSGRSDTLCCTWAAVVPSADWVHPSPVLPSQSSDSLVPLSASDRACSWNKKAYWVVPVDVSTDHVNMAVHELTEQFISKGPLLDSAALTMLSHQDPRVGFAAINHMASLLRGPGGGILQPSSWMVVHIGTLQKSMGLPARSHGKPLPARYSGYSSSASGKRARDDSGDHDDYH